jgi:CBS domain-containing protein
MQDQVLFFLEKQGLFSKLPKEELERISDIMTSQSFPAGYILSVQGRSKLDSIYLIKSGAMELYYSSNGKEEHTGLLNPGDIFGGISILMNAGISIRSVRIVADARLYVLPRADFLDICTRFPEFYESFAARYRSRMADQSYASIVSAGQALNYISRLVPFSFLPPETLDHIAAATSVINYPAGTKLFVQGQSRIEYLYIIYKGAAERYFEEDGQKTLRGIMAEGDMYGGISMLLNNGISIRSLSLTEDASFYVLPKAIFLDICDRYDAVSDFFTDIFGKRMLDRSYAEIISRNFVPSEASPQVFNQPVSNAYSPELVSCEENMPIQAAAAVMSEQNTSSIFVRNVDGDYIGMVTDNDLRKKVTAAGYDILKPVADIMSVPLSTISLNALLFEALMEMMKKNIKHLAVTDASDRVVGVITNRDLLKAQGQSPFFIIREIAQAKFVNQLVQIRRQVPRLVQVLINTGAKPRNVTRFLTTVSDAILEKLIGFALEELGEPPVDFVFMILGSEGRQEQTLKTDQDNAIVFKDVDEERLPAVMKYFLTFGNKVCTWLDEVGYDFCKGGVMAKNEQWCQPLAQWQKYFAKWIHTAEPEALLQASIFFDFRAGYGNEELLEELRSHLFKALEGWPGFFRHMAENALYFTPPIGFFRNFVVESKGEHRDAFDIKAAMQPIVDYGRIYALKHRIDLTNTIQRLDQLLTRELITEQEHTELETAYSYLMQQRFVRQVSALLEEDGKPDNYINPKKLSRIEQTTLKEIFKRIERFQGKLRFDFTGAT